MARLGDENVGGEGEGGGGHDEFFSEEEGEHGDDTRPGTPGRSLKMTAACLRVAGP
jgi:hypothetical protein